LTPNRWSNSKLKFEYTPNDIPLSRNFIDFKEI
jgi:hypothetical protein